MNYNIEVISVRSVDLNNLIPKAQQISKIQHLQNNKHKNFVHNQALDQNKKFEKELKKVNTSKKAFNAKINDKHNRDKKRENYFQDKSKGREDKDKEEDGDNKPIKNGTIGLRIDIKV